MGTLNDVLAAEAAEMARAADSQWLNGAEGDRVRLQGMRVLSTRVIESEYGEVTLVKLLHGERDQCVWWASGTPSELRRNAGGEWYWAPIYVEGFCFDCSATIKAFKDYQGVCETQLTRITRELDPDEAEFRRSYRKQCKRDGIETNTPEYERGYALGLERVREGDGFVEYDPELGF